MNDTDKELLVFAAIAVDMQINFTAFEDFGIFDEISEEYWNPLTSDGDALRLAVKLELVIMPHGGSVEAYIGDIECEEFIEDDPYAATRRAIVRAAAEIGKSIK